MGSTGALTTTWNAAIGGTLQTGGNANVRLAGGQNALYFSTVAGTRQWYSGVISTGVYYIARSDVVGGAPDH